MKAYIVNRYGKNERMQLVSMPEPVVKENEVLVQIHSAGVNLLDSLLRNGDFKIFLPYKPPFKLGHDVAGVVTKIGSGVTRFKVGDGVYSRPSNYNMGAFAEEIAINENDVALKPKNISMEEAGSIPLVGLTAWQALVEIAKLKKGQKVFIQAGSGGVGTFAIQLAKHLGATVATTTSAGNFELVKGLGADIVIDYKHEDFETKLKDYDVVLHSNSDKKILVKSLSILKKGGQLISITGPPTPEFAKQLGLPWHLKLITKILSVGVKKHARKLNVNFSFLFMRAEGNQLSQITKLIESGAIKPVVDRIFPFEQVNEAMAYVESSRAKGKVIVRVK